jgi:hypothetical protein
MTEFKFVYWLLAKESTKKEENRKENVEIMDGW